MKIYVEIDSETDDVSVTYEQGDIKETDHMTKDQYIKLISELK